MVSNAVSAAVRIETVSAREDFDLFDSFPACVRRAVAESPVKWTSASIVRAYAGRGLTAAQVAERIRAANELEVRRFSIEHELLHGHVLPHVAARGSILGWGFK